tara:strand:- start:3026 stop:3352 length:327 start_codon:yes stop_codon:yes gene_type:complete
MPILIDYFRDFMSTTAWEYLNNTFTLVFNGSIVYFMWIFIHFISVHLYINFCVPLTLYGFISSPFLVPAPHCYGLRWLMNNGSDNIIAMWSVLGGYLITVFRSIAEKK